MILSEAFKGAIEKKQIRLEIKIHFFSPAIKKFCISLHTYLHTNINEVPSEHSLCSKSFLKKNYQRGGKTMVIKCMVPFWSQQKQLLLFIAS